MKQLLAICLCLSLGACYTVRQSDLDAWVGQPVERLDLHPIFLTMPKRESVASNGVIARIYSKKVISTDCDRFGCTSGEVGCDNIFYIKDGRVIQYLPVGQCFTTSKLQPQF